MIEKLIAVIAWQLLIHLTIRLTLWLTPRSWHRVLLYKFWQARMSNYLLYRIAKLAVLCALAFIAGLLGFTPPDE